jgi:hypothetical protein
LASFETLPLGEKPYVNLHNFKYYKYLNDRVIKHLRGNKASLATIDRIELEGDVVGWRYLTDVGAKQEEVEANFVQSHLSSQRLDDFQGLVNVKDTLLKGGVIIRREDLVIETQEAHYLGSEKDMIVGDKPVHATLKRQTIDAEKGFQLDLKNEVINLLGTVRGVIIPDESK